MKRLGVILAAGAVIVSVALPAVAQQAAPAQNFTVSFGGQMRVFGLVWDNMTDFADTDKRNPVEQLLNLPPDRTAGGACLTGPGKDCNKDSDAYYFQRWRLFTTVESADKNAKVVWAIEVGDITYGLGGGASGDEYGTGVNARNGTSQGGGLGADGANVETKNLYLQFNIPWVPGANILLGAHNVVFMTSPAGAFVDDDGWGIQLNFKFDPVDLQLYTVKIDENSRASADDNTMYAARVGVNLTPDTRITVEGLTVDQQCYARRPTGATRGPAGSCVSADFFDTFWIGATVGTKLAGITLHASGIYGQRQLFSLPNSTALLADEQIEESGWGFQVTAQVPIGPVSTWWHGWYMTGDKSRITGGGCEDVVANPQCARFLPAGGGPTGVDFSTNANSTNLVTDSDKLPIPITGASWGNVPFVAEFLRGLFLIGAPGFGSTHYADATGTWGVGGSASFALTPAFSIGGGAAYIAATEDAQAGGCPGTASGCGGGVYGDQAVELDAGVIWRYNPNLTISGLGGYVIPDEGDDAWALTFRTQFSF